MDYIREHKKGLIGALVYHLVILLLFILFGFITPLPLPGAEGIVVNFGDSETGFGEIEPSPVKDAPVPLTTEKEKEVVPVTPPPVAEKVLSQPGKEEVMTQDFEKTAAIEAAKKKREEERKQALEIERQRQAELERQRVEAEIRKKQEDEKRKIAEIDSRTKDAFG